MYTCIEKIDSCIEKLSSDLLSSILPKCETIALDLRDYNNWTFLRLQNVKLGENLDVRNQYASFCKQNGKTDEYIAEQFTATKLLFLKARVIEKDKINSDTVYEIESKISSLSALLETLTLPEGMAPIDIYYRSEDNRKAKTEMLTNLAILNTRYGQIKNSVLNVLIEMRQKAAEQSRLFPTQDNTLKEIKRIFDKFHNVARQLRSRYDKRCTIEIQDEYDVQDLLHALLKLYFDDVRPEEWTPSYAGSSSRMDFLVKSERVVIEVKKARKGLDDKLLGEQLIVDIEKYKSHPDCKKLLCFVYDPEGRLGNPTGIANDLNTMHNGFVEVIIKP